VYEGEVKDGKEQGYEDDDDDDDDLDGEDLEAWEVHDLDDLGLDDGQSATDGEEEGATTRETMFSRLKKMPGQALDNFKDAYKKRQERRSSTRGEEEERKSSTRLE